MEKKNNIQLATFFGLGFFATGLGNYNTTIDSSATQFAVVIAFIFNILPIIGALLLAWVAGEIYNSRK